MKKCIVNGPVSTGTASAFVSSETITQMATNMVSGRAAGEAASRSAETVSKPAGRAAKAPVRRHLYEAIGIQTEPKG